MSHHHHHHLHHHNNDNMFEKLESGNKDDVENFKYSIREQFSKVQEPWLINGLYDYYLKTSSVRCMEVIITLREPHQQYLFDRLCDSIKNPKTEANVRVQALNLLGHMAGSQPTWLLKLPEHNLFKELLRFIKTEAELVPLISALLVLMVLLPMFPSHIGEYYLEDIFDIFSRLASWNSHVPSKLVEVQIIHLQVALYALFIRLYGMYPCNFLNYLQEHYKDRNNPVFCHTIKPMMDTVKMHSSLVTNSKEIETSTERWKKMGVHDVIVECERFSLDITDRCPHETCQNTTEFRSRSGTMNSTVGNSSESSASYHQQNIKNLASLQMTGGAISNEPSNHFFSPSQVYQVQTPPITESTGVSHRQIQGLISRSNYPASQEGSPPEAAIEATPETTPIRDFTNQAPLVHRTSKSNVARALTSFRGSTGGYIVSGTPTNSVPSSPMRKEPSAFVFPTATSTLSQNMAARLLQEKLSYQQQQGSSETIGVLKPVPSSPLKIATSSSSSDNSSYARQQQQQRVESPMSQEDEEVSFISADMGRINKKRPSEIMKDLHDSDFKELEADAEHGSPCTEGGLHMPNSKSITNFKKRIRRIRKNSSQCNPDTILQMSTGSSPGNGSVTVVPFAGNAVVRRARSLPDMKKSPQVLAKTRKPFYETDEETVSEDQVSNTSNGVTEGGRGNRRMQKEHAGTQTEVFWPMPYEHLFFNIFPSLKEESMEIKPSPAPSPAPALNQAVEPYRPSLYDILDKYIEKCVATADNNTVRDQLQLLHQQFLFERHRRETHAYRNRRLLSDAKSTRLLEEYNSALRDQVQLGQQEIDDLRQQLEDYRREATANQRQLCDTIESLQDKFKTLSEENARLRETNGNLQSNLTNYQAKFDDMDKERQQAEAALVDALAEGKVCKEQAQAGEKLKEELQRVNRELLLMGELHVKYREQLEKLRTVRGFEVEKRKISDAYAEEVKHLQSVIDSRTTTIDAFKSRIVELEHSVAAKDEIVAGQKRTLAAVNEAREAVLESLESKYQTQLAINRTLEEKILELRQKFETEQARRRTHSPDTSSCHEVQASSSCATAPPPGGGSVASPQHSSPLSVSLASSEGSSVVHDLRNVLMNVDQDGGGGGSKAYLEEHGKND